MKHQFFEFLESIGIGYKYLINGFIGSLVWSLYKKTKILEAIRQIFIGSIVAGYFTPFIAKSESISVEFLAALSFVVGMTGMVILDAIYKFVSNKIKAVKAGEKVIKSED